MKARKEGFTIPARTEILAGGFVLVMLATIAIIRGGPQLTRAAEPPSPRYLPPAPAHVNAQSHSDQRASHATGEKTGNVNASAPQSHQTDVDVDSTDSQDLPGRLPPKSLTDSH